MLFNIAMDNSPEFSSPSIILHLLAIPYHEKCVSLFLTHLSSVKGNGRLLITDLLISYLPKLLFHLGTCLFMGKLIFSVRPTLLFYRRYSCAKSTPNRTSLPMCELLIALPFSSLSKFY